MRSNLKLSATDAVLMSDAASHAVHDMHDTRHDLVFVLDSPTSAAGAAR